MIKTSKGPNVEIIAIAIYETSSNSILATKIPTKESVFPNTKRRLFIAGNCNAKYTLPINLKTNVAHTIMVES